MTIATLYRRRKRDAAFAAAWAAAVSHSGAPMRPIDFRPAPAGRVAGPSTLLRTGKAGRLRFDAERRTHFLAWLEATGNTGWAAEGAGVHRSTVFRRIARDPGFARACLDALARCFEALAGEVERKDAAKAAAAGTPIVATGRFTEDFELGLKLLARWERPAARGNGARAWRRRRAPLPLAKALAAIERKLQAIGIPIRGAGGRPGIDAPEEDKGAAGR